MYLYLATGRSWNSEKPVIGLLCYKIKLFPLARTYSLHIRCSYRALFCTVTSFNWAVTGTCLLRPRVADPGFLSRIQIFFHSECGISDPATARNRSGKSKLVFYFFCSHKFHKIENWLTFELVQKKIRVNWQRILAFLPQKIVTKLQNIQVGSEIG